MDLYVSQNGSLCKGIEIECVCIFTARMKAVQDLMFFSTYFVKWRKNRERKRCSIVRNLEEASIRSN